MPGDMSAPALPTVIVHPPTPMSGSPVRQHDATLLYPYLPFGLASALDDLTQDPPEDLYSYYDEEEEKQPLDYSLLLPPKTPRRRRRLPSHPSHRYGYGYGSKRQSSYVGMSLIALAGFIVFLTTIASLSPLRLNHDHIAHSSLHDHMDDDHSHSAVRFGHKLNLGISMDLHPGSLWRDLTLGDIWSSWIDSVAKDEADQAEAQAEGAVAKVGRAKVMSRGAWEEYKTGQDRGGRAGAKAAATNMEFWDFH